MARILTIKRRDPKITNETFTFYLTAYEKDDLLTDMLAPRRGHGFDQILRPCLNHISANKTGRPKTRVILGMVKLIFRKSLEIYMRELLKGEQVEIPDIGYMQMRTTKFRFNYHGWDRQRQKEKNRSDAPYLYPSDMEKGKKAVYYVWLHGLSLRRLNALIDKGKKYYD